MNFPPLHNYGFDTFHCVVYVFILQFDEGRRLKITLIISVDHIHTDDGELQSFKIELFEIPFWVRAIK